MKLAGEAHLLAKQIKSVEINSLPSDLFQLWGFVYIRVNSGQLSRQRKLLAVTINLVCKLTCTADR